MLPQECYFVGGGVLLPVINNVTFPVNHIIVKNVKIQYLTLGLSLIFQTGLVQL